MSNALMKPVRVIHEVTPTEQFIRAVERATQIREAARARADADFVERVEEAQERYLMKPEETPAMAQAQEALAV